MRSLSGAIPDAGSGSVLRFRSCAPGPEASYTWSLKEKKPVARSSILPHNEGNDDDQVSTRISTKRSGAALSVKPTPDSEALGKDG